MQNALLILQIVISIALSALILLQAKGTGLGRAFGQSSYHSKRGVEVVVFRFTIVLAVSFVIVSLANQLV